MNLSVLNPEADTTKELMPWNHPNKVDIRRTTPGML